MSEKPKNGLEVGPTMSIRMTLSTIGAIIYGFAVIVWEAAEIMHKMDRYHDDCVKLYGKSWHIADEVEASHQTAVANGHRPDPSEVLRVTRSVNANADAN